MNVIGKYKYARVVKRMLATEVTPETFVYINDTFPSTFSYTVVVGYLDTETGYKYFKMGNEYYRTITLVHSIDKYNLVPKPRKRAQRLEGLWINENTSNSK